MVVDCERWRGGGGVKHNKTKTQDKTKTQVTRGRKREIETIVTGQEQGKTRQDKTGRDETRQVQARPDQTKPARPDQQNEK
jgi:hypothetical protein